MSESSPEVAFPGLDTITGSLLFREEKASEAFCFRVLTQASLLNLVCTGRWPLKARL